MNTTFSKFDPADNADKYMIKKFGSALHLVEISSKRVMDYLLLDESITNMNPAWFGHIVELAKNPFFEIMVPMPEFLIRHEEIIQEREQRERDNLSTRN